MTADYSVLGPSGVTLAQANQARWAWAKAARFLGLMK